MHSKLILISFYCTETLPQKKSTFVQTAQISSTEESFWLYIKSPGNLKTLIIVWGLQLRFTCYLNREDRKFLLLQPAQSSPVKYKWLSMTGCVCTLLGLNQDTCIHIWLANVCECTVGNSRPWNRARYFLLLLKCLQLLSSMKLFPPDYYWLGLLQFTLC